MNALFCLFVSAKNDLTHNIRLTSLTQGDKTSITMQGRRPWSILISTNWCREDLEAILILQFRILSYKLVYFDKHLSWMPYDLTDDKSASVQIMTWCHLAKRSVIWTNLSKHMVFHKKTIILNTDLCGGSFLIWKIISALWVIIHTYDGPCLRSI